MRSAGVAPKGESADHQPFQPEKEMIIMAIRDLIPWSRQENRLPATIGAGRDPSDHPLLSLHREVNRLFDDVFRGFGVPSLGGADRSFTWPNLELGETDKEVRITAELPGLEEKD